MPQVNMNTIIVGGNLTRNPEVRFTAGGTPVCQLGLAINNRIKKGDEWVDDPCFVDVVVFGKSAEYIGENADKGHSVLVHGRLQYRSWEDKEGNKRSKHEIVAERIYHLGKSSRDEGGEGRSTGRKSTTREPGEDDDVPF